MYPQQGRGSYGGAHADYQKEYIKPPASLRERHILGGNFDIVPAHSELRQC